MRSCLVRLYALACLGRVRSNLGARVSLFMQVHLRGRAHACMHAREPPPPPPPPPAYPREQVTFVSDEVSAEDDEEAEQDEDDHGHHPSDHGVVHPRGSRHGRGV